MTEQRFPRRWDKLRAWTVHRDRAAKVGRADRGKCLLITLCREHPFTVPLRTLISVLARVLCVPTDSGFPLLPRTGYPWMITEGYSVLSSLLHRCPWGDTGISLRPRRTLDFSCARCKLVHFTAGLCHDFHVTNVFLFFFFF